MTDFRELIQREISILYYVVYRIIFTQIISSYKSVGEFEIKLPLPVVEGKLICFYPILDIVLQINRY